MNSARFWLVWQDGGRMAAHKHESLGKASDEAKRLAKKHPTEGFVVLESVGHYTVAEPPVEWQQHETMPEVSLI